MSITHPCFLLVDDHALFRTGLALMLRQAWPQAHVVQAAGWGEALRFLQGDEPDLILLDVHLPDGHGLADLAALRTHAPACPVLLMSAEVGAAQVRQAAAAGVKGFLPKSATAQEVMAAVRTALAGEHAFAAQPYETEHSATVLHAQEAGAALTARQIEILRYLGRGTPNKAIARQLGMSETAVRAEVSWLTERLGAHSREEAYASAVALGWIPQ